MTHILQYVKVMLNTQKSIVNPNIHIIFAVQNLINHQTLNTMTDLEKLYNDVQAPIINEEQRRIAEGKKQEAEWLKRTQEFMSKIGFLVEKFSLYISVEDERGHRYYPGEKNIWIRSKRTIGYISIYPDGRIHNNGCCNVDTPLMGTTYNTIEDFVKAVAKANA